MFGTSRLIWATLAAGPTQTSLTKERPLISLQRIFLSCAMALVATSPLAQQLPPLQAPQNLVQLTASASIEVPQDLLSLSMNTSREGADAANVQVQLKQALDAALAEAKKAALPGQLEVRTGNFSLYPRYGRDGKLTTWQGSAELVLEGRDFARIGATAGKIQTLTIGAAMFSLSREQRGKVEGETQAAAIDRFKIKAAEITKSFGFSGYTLREVTVSANDQGPVPRPRVMALESRVASAEAPVPLEAGKSSVVVTVSGSVQMK